MKTKIFVALIIVSSVAFAQDSLISGGNFLGSGGGVRSSAPVPPRYRVVNGKVYDANNHQLWHLINGQIEDISGSKILISWGNQWVIVTNYTGEKAMDVSVTQWAIKVGTEKWPGSVKTGNGVYEVWDCGSVYVYVPTPAEIEAQKRAAEAAAKAKAERQWLMDSNTVRWLNSEATNGSTYAQYDLATYYLNGRGCETNRDLAIYWLKQAASNGDVNASNKLAKLKKD